LEEKKMRFSAWLEEKEEIFITAIPPGQDYLDKPQIAGQTNYVLQLVAGASTAAQTVEGTLGPVIRPQLERLRDRLIQMFPPPQIGTTATGAGVPKKP
jgi:hypothetical protein